MMPSCPAACFIFGQSTLAFALAKNALNGRQRSDSEINAKLHSLLAGLMDSLAADGVALAFHESPASDMFRKLGLELGAAMHDATVRIAAAAHAHRKILLAMPLESKLDFPDVSLGTLDAFKDLSRWQDFTEATADASWLKKSLFALHNLSETDESGVSLRGGRG